MFAGIDCKAVWGSDVPGTMFIICKERALLRRACVHAQCPRARAYEQDTTQNYLMQSICSNLFSVALTEHTVAYDQ